MGWFREIRCEKSIEGHKYVYKEVVMQYSNAGASIEPEYYEVHRCTKCGGVWEKYVGSSPR